MKNFFLLLLLCVTIASSAQVGINTTNPSATLDVNGTMRLRGTAPSLYEEEVEAVKIVGMDLDGNLVEVELGDNIILENNKLSVVERKVAIGDVPDINLTEVNNLSLIILPGEPNDDKNVIKIKNSLGDIIITGFEAAPDGTLVWLFPLDGELELKVSDPNSLPANQILADNDVRIKQYGMQQIMYDATLQKWIVMHR